jgi:hypothetical protein
MSGLYRSNMVKAWATTQLIALTGAWRKNDGLMPTTGPLNSTHDTGAEDVAFVPLLLLLLLLLFTAWIHRPTNATTPTSGTDTQNLVPLYRLPGLPAAPNSCISQPSRHRTAVACALLWLP